MYFNLMQESIIAASAHKINPFFCFLQKNFAAEQTKGKITRRGCRKNGDPDGPCHGGKGALGEERRENDEAGRGVRARERERDGFAVTDVHILDRRGEAALGKPAGRYVTLELPPLARDVRPAAEALAGGAAAAAAPAAGAGCARGRTRKRGRHAGMPSGRCACAGCS